MCSIVMTGSVEHTEIRRRTRVVGAFPDGQSALNREAAPHRRHGVVCEEISIRDDRRAFLDASARVGLALAALFGSPAQLTLIGKQDVALSVTEKI